jgi:hypothetical protein
MQSGLKPELSHRRPAVPMRAGGCGPACLLSGLLLLVPCWLLLSLSVLVSLSELVQGMEKQRPCSGAGTCCAVPSETVG